MTDLVGYKGRRENKDHVVIRVTREIGETPVHQVHLDRWGYQDQQDPKATG